MDRSLLAWLTVLCAGICVWFYLNSSMQIDYARHPQLIDQQTGEKKSPKELLQLAKVIKYTPAYINSTNAQERLYDLEYYLNFENPFLLDHSYSKKEDLQVSGWPVSNQTKCGQHLKWILDNIQAHPNYSFDRGQLGYELTNLMDAFGRRESGHYSGAFNWLGSQRVCQKVSLDEGKIKTRYCIGRMRPKWWPSNETIYPKTSIRLGLCLPETCDTLSFEQHKENMEILAKLNLPKLYKEGLDFDSMFCLPDERSPIRQIPQSGRILMIVVGCWLFTVLIGTLIHELWFHKRRTRRSELTGGEFMVNVYNISQKLANQENSPKNSTVLAEFTTTVNSCSGSTTLVNILEDITDALSLRSCLKSFKSNTFRVKYNQGHRVRVNLTCLDFVKCAMTLLVVLGHSGYLSSIYARSLANRIELSTGDLGRLTLSVSRCVDTFFFFFGVLTTYTLMRKLNIKQLANPLIWLGVNFGVLLRIAPLFMLVYWYSKSISPYLGSGPWWDYGVDQYSMKGVCMSDPWWRSIPYFGSYGSPAVPTCLLPGWFLVSYSQISLILPLLTYVICKLPNHASRLVLAIFLLLTSAFSIGLRLYTQTSVGEEAFTFYGSFLSDLLEKFESTGNMTTLARLGGVSVGCFTGYMLRIYELRQIKRWPSWLFNKLVVVLVLGLHVLVVLLPMFGHKFSSNLVSLKEFVSFNMITVVIWPIMNAILTIYAATVYNHKAIVRFCSHSFWHILNRLGLAIFLVHWEVIFVAMTSFEEAPSYGYVTDVMKMWAFGTLVSVFVAFFLHITIEAPLSRLVMVPLNIKTKANSETSIDCEEAKEAKEAKIETM